MTTTAKQPRSVDIPVFFPSDEQTYFGLVTMPDEGISGDTGVILLEGTHAGTTTLGRNRVWVSLAHSLADAGYPTLRFDYAGSGESLPGPERHDIRRPAVDAFARGVEHLRERGVQRVVAVGTCFGARTAMVGALEEDAISGLVLLAPPIGLPKKGGGGATHLAVYANTGELARRAATKRNLRKLATTKKARAAARKVVEGKVKMLVGRGPTDASGQQIDPSEAADSFVEPLRQLSASQVPVCLVYGEDDMYWREFQRAQEGRLGTVLQEGDDYIDIEIVPGLIRGMISLGVQDACSRVVMDRVSVWSQ